MPPRILIAGIGNIFLGDDAFGVEVVRRLAARSLPENVRVIDFGIRGFDLTMALLEDLDVVILVDAAPRGGTPGTLYIIEPAPDENGGPVPGEVMLDPHSLDPVKVLRLVKSMGGRPGRLLVVGCEPETVGSDEDWDVTPGLSEPVQRAVGEAIVLIESLIGEAHSSQHMGGRGSVRAAVSVRLGRSLAPRDLFKAINEERSTPMKVLETLAGAVIAVFSVLILLVGMLFAVGSMGKYIRNKNM